MMVDMTVIFSGERALIVAGVLTTIAIFSKWIAAWIAQLIFKYSAAQRNLIFGLTGSRVAATLAVILIGFNLGIVSENVLNGTIRSEEHTSELQSLMRNSYAGFCLQ